MKGAKGGEIKDGTYRAVLSHQVNVAPAGKLATQLAASAAGGVHVTAGHGNAH